MLNLLYVIFAWINVINMTISEIDILRNLSIPPLLRICLGIILVINLVVVLNIYDRDNQISLSIT